MDKILYSSLKNYFKTLKHFGYNRYKSVEQLLILDFIHKLLQPEFKNYLKEEDYTLINKLLYKLSKENCLISIYKGIPCTSCQEGENSYSEEDETFEKLITISFDSKDTIGIQINNQKYILSERGSSFSIKIDKY